MTEEEFNRRLTPTVRLFLSVDLENSTKLKNGATSSGEEWLTAVLLFAKSFPQLFDAQLQEHGRTNGRPPLVVPPVWKMLGDELIFVKPVGKAHDIVVYVEAFRNSLDLWNQDVAKGKKRGPLRVKGAGWLAGFPITNVVFDAGDQREDYAGPSMDAGFRIARQATPRHLVVSVDLAWLLLKANMSGNIHFDGPAQLKGLAEETGYPSLWIEVGRSAYLKAERQMLGYREQSNREDLQNFCAHFICEFGVPRHVPFIETDPDFSSKPENYDNDLRLRTEFMRRDIYLVDGQEPIPAAIGGDGGEIFKSILDRLKKQQGDRSS